MSISKKRLKEISNIKDKSIDYSDIPELDECFFKNAEIKIPEAKKNISIRIDTDVLEWFKSRGRGYQGRMNAILKAYMEHYS